MNKNQIIHIIHNASNAEALDAWSMACREYENDPSTESDLLEIHNSCVDKILKIVNEFNTIKEKS